MKFFSNNFFNFLNIEIGLTIVVIGLYFMLMRFVKKYSTQRTTTKTQNTKYIQFFRLCLIVFSMLLLTLIWGLNTKGIWIFSSVILGSISVTIFTTSSVLSNVLGASILFFLKPFQIGNLILLKDGDDSLKGEITAMTLFYIELKLEDGGTANIPNNIIFQKIIIKYPINHEIRQQYLQFS